MTRRYLLTFCSMLVVLGSYLIYSRFSQALMTPPEERTAVAQRPVIESIPYAGSKISQEIAEKYLPDAPWAMEARAKIRAEGLHLFFNENKLVNGNREVEVSPVAIVWTNEEEGSGAREKESPEPLVILADKATFQLDEAVELSEIRTRLIRQIKLRGDVSIRGEDGLKVHGKNFVFSRDNNHIRSDQPVEFQFQNHHGAAKQIQLTLDIRDGGEYADNPQIRKLVDLYVYEHFELHLQADPEKPPAHVTCEGYFQYDFESQHAVLNRDVRIHQKDELGLMNSLTCDQLELQFAKKENAAREAEATETESGNGAFAAADSMELVELKATGDAVVAKSSRHQFEAVGEILVYDLRERKITLRKRRDVEIRYLGTVLTTPRLEIELDEAQRPLLAYCSGQGSMAYFEENADTTTALTSALARASWNDSLTFRPDERSGGKLDVITLTGKAVLQSPEQQMGIIAESIRIWLERLQPASASSDASGHQMSEMAGNFKLVRTLAEHEVAVVSPYLEGEYESLDVNYHPVNNEKQRPTVAGNHSETGGQEQDPFSGHSESQLPPEPFRFDAKRLILQVSYDPEQKRVDRIAHVKTEGKVRAHGLLNGQEEPINLDGQSVEVTNESPQDQRFHLLGTTEKYASIRNGEMRIDGIDLIVDRGQNFSHVKGSGAIQFPVNSRWDGGEADKPRVLEVNWQEQMHFAGQVAHFIGGVEAQLGDAVIRCEELKVHLDQPVSLQQTEWKIKPKIAEIECRDRVRFEMNQYEEGKLVGIRYLNVWSFRVNQQSGKMLAQGPGSMEVWQLANGKSPLGLPEATMTAKRNSSPKKQQEKGNRWDYTRVTFAGQMTGNYLKRRGTLTDRVNILHGPVAEPLVRFDRDHRPENSVWVRSDRLEVWFKEPTKPVQQRDDDVPRLLVEVNVLGNAEIEGDTFQARADRISYDHENRLFIMNSDENRNATIWHYKHPNAARSRFDVKRIRLSPDGNILELDRTQGASGSG